MPTEYYVHVVKTSGGVMSSYSVIQNEQGGGLGDADLSVPCSYHFDIPKLQKIPVHVPVSLSLSYM